MITSDVTWMMVIRQNVLLTAAGMLDLGLEVSPAASPKLGPGEGDKGVTDPAQTPLIALGPSLALM